MHFLPLKRAAHLDNIHLSGRSHRLSWNSPATSAMTDFFAYRPPVLEGDTRAALAEQLMLQEHAQLKIVIDKNDNFIGLVTLDDVCSQRVMQCVVNGMDRDEVRVKHLMQPRASLMTLQYSELEGNSVADVAYTLKKDGVQHCLIIDKEYRQLRGIISAVDLAERLGVNLSIHTAPTFASLVQTLHE